MNLSYRTRRTLRRVGLAALALLLVLALVVVIWVLWLDRYVVYSRDGVEFDFERSAENMSGVVAQPPEPRETVNIIYNEGAGAVDTSIELNKLYGYYISSDMLSDKMQMVQNAVAALPNGSTVMIDVKSAYGYFFYTSGLGETSEDVQTGAVDALIADMKSRNMYLIARVPAFRDYYYGLKHTENGLWMEGHFGLWWDEDSCYWLDPAKSGTLNRLIQIVTELKGLGFQEVVFSEFRFPDGMNEIEYEAEDLQQVLNTAAQSLVTSCTTTTFAVSFDANFGELTLPEGRCRQYVRNVSAVSVQDAAGKSGLPDPFSQMVVITDSNDTRFDAYGVLRPITQVEVDDDTEDRQ